MFVAKGAIWYTKSLNEYNYTVEGMTAGSKLVFTIGNHYSDKNLFTYLKIFDKYDKFRYPIVINNQVKFIDYSQMYTGNTAALHTLETRLDFNTTNTIINKIKYSDKNLNKYFILNKFKIKVVVIENEDVKIDILKRIILSDKAKQDIINTKDENDLNLLCGKYQIYPIKALKEIKSRLIYKAKLN